MKGSVPWVRLVAAGAAALTVLTLALRRAAFPLHLDWTWCLSGIAVATGLSLWLARRQARRLGGEAAWTGDEALGFVLAAATLLYLVSSVADDTWFYFLRWGPARSNDYPIWRSGLFRLGLWGTLLTPLFFRRRRGAWLLFPALLIVSQILCLQHLFDVTGGSPVYRDDHPSFMYRFWAFSRVLPAMVYYDPFWNGGIVTTHHLSSGTLPPALLFWPLWRFARIELIYTPVLALLFIVGVPLISAIAVRISGGGRTAAWTGALLALGISHSHFLWFLHFGTVGANLASSFLPLVCAGLFRALWMDGREKWLLPLVAVSIPALVAWPPSVIAALPVLLACAVSGRMLTRFAVRRLIFAGAAAAILAAPAFLVIVRHSDPAGFVAAHTGSVSLRDALGKGASVLGDQLRRANPLLVLLGLAGAWFLPRRGAGAFYGTVLSGLAAIAGWAEQWKPQLQLERMAIPLFFVAVIPAALWIERLWEASSLRLAPVRAVLIALLALGGLNVAKVYGNKGPAPYEAMGPPVREMVAWIRQNTDRDARILFAGSTVHAYGRGHVAFLPVLTGRQMMACDYYHFSPKRVEYDYPPRAFREEDQDVFDFLELYNVGYVVTYHEPWKRVFRRHAELCEETRVFPGQREKSVFRMKRAPTWFQKGSGHVRAGINELAVSVDDPGQDVILRYNWVEGLAADPPVEIRPCDMGRGVRFIAADPHGKREFRIRCDKWL
jgi:hypothetical protein